MSYLIYFLSGLLGLLFVTIAMAISFQNDAVKANIEFSFKKYFQRETLNILLSVVSVLTWLILFGEVAGKYPQIQNFIRCSFFAMGAIGSWAIQQALSKTRKWIGKVVDEKTNIADGVTGTPDAKN